MQQLASADALRSISGDRHKARWEAAAIHQQSPLLTNAINNQDDLFTQAPSVEKDIFDDFKTLGHTLRAHPVSLLREKWPFHRCTKSSELITKKSGGFIMIAGLVTCRQRPGSASGTMFLTIEDEDGDINVIVWSGTQEYFRKEILTSKLMLIKGTVEILAEHVATPVIHVIAGNMKDISHKLEELVLKARNFH